MARAIIQHDVVSNDSLFYHMNNVACTGHENILTECERTGVGIKSCRTRHEEAGVICFGELFV